MNGAVGEQGGLLVFQCAPGSVSRSPSGDIDLGGRVFRYRVQRSGNQLVLQDADHGGTPDQYAYQGPPQ